MKLCLIKIDLYDLVINYFNQSYQFFVFLIYLIFFYLCRLDPTRGSPMGAHGQGTRMAHGDALGKLHQQTPDPPPPAAVIWFIQRSTTIAQYSSTVELLFAVYQPWDIIGPLLSHHPITIRLPSTTTGQHVAFDPPRAAIQAIFVNMWRLRGRPRSR